MPKKTIAAASLILAASLLLAGCGGADSPEGSGGPAESGSSQPAATGDTITGTGYTYNVPEGWGEPEQSIPGFTPDSLAADLTDTDGFADNINVILSPAGEVTAEQVETAGVAELEGAGYGDVTIEDRVQVAGSEAAHLSATLTQGDTTSAMNQFYVNADGQTYIVTFSYNVDVSDADRAAVYDAVLASWAWD